MTLISAPIVTQLQFDREKIVHLWLQETDERLKVAALQYLAVCGKAEDLAVIRTEYERGNYQTVGAATDAILRVTLRESRGDALKVLNERQPERVDPRVVRALFSKPGTIETTLLVSTATHRSSMVRNAAVAVLADRRSLPPELAEQLLADTDAGVRFHSLCSLVEGGRDYPDEAAKSILVRPTSGIGLGALSYSMAAAVPDKPGESFYQKFKTARLRRLREAALERVIAAEGLFDRDARFAQVFNNFNKRGADLRAAIDDKFKAIVSGDIKELEGRSGTEVVPFSGTEWRLG